jgi:hypothetical protein
VAERGRGLLLRPDPAPAPARGVFCSIVELQAAINRYIDEHNDDPAPFVWTKTADQITAKLNRLNASMHSHVPFPECEA